MGNCGSSEPPKKTPASKPTPKPAPKTRDLVAEKPEARWIPKGGLNAEEKRIRSVLEGIGQGSLFAQWATTGTDDEAKHAFFKQCKQLDEDYPGGLQGYYKSAQQLLASSARGDNPLAGYKPKVPEGVHMFRSNPKYDEYTDYGLQEIAQSAFVLVAGGLGERLGFPGIKLSLPVDTATEMCYLGLYCAALKAWYNEAKSPPSTPIPLAIMTSDDTHDATQALIDENKNFGLAEGQIILMKQGKVPALKNGAADFAADPSNPYKLVTKPHGHGDVHQLLYQRGLAKQWAQEGRKWVVFFQDTHALAIRKIPSLLGVSAKEEFMMNSMSIPRRCGEATGAICHLEAQDAGKNSLTMNVEYNQLEPLLLDTTGEGDVAGEDGMSRFPGNVNTFAIQLGSYVAVLEKGEGKVPEFVNPKYTDDTRTAFKAPTRLECMMQDLPKSFPAGAKLGFTCFERELYSPCKNATPDGAKKQQAGQLPGCAAACEADWYTDNAKMLKLAGAKVDAPKEDISYLGVKWTAGARVHLHPSFAPTLSILKQRVGNVKMTARSTLVVQGKGVVLENLDLDGALIIRAHDDCKVIVNKTVKNDGYPLVPLSTEELEGDCRPEIKIRGYDTDRDEKKALVKRFDEPGEKHIGKKADFTGSFRSGRLSPRGSPRGTNKTSFKGLGSSTRSASDRSPRGSSSPKNSFKAKDSGKSLTGSSSGRNRSTSPRASSPKFTST